jgi:hypothetical protein
MRARAPSRPALDDVTNGGLHRLRDHFVWHGLVQAHATIRTVIDLSAAPSQPKPHRYVPEGSGTLEAFDALNEESGPTEQTEPNGDQRPRRRPPTPGRAAKQRHRQRDGQPTDKSDCGQPADSARQHITHGGLHGCRWYRPAATAPMWQ